MKKILSLMLAVCGLLLFAGCSDSPKDVAKKYTVALVDGDLEKANEYSTERTHKLNAWIIGMMSDSESKEKVKKDLDESLDKIDDCREEIDGDTAKLYEDENDKTPMILKKVDGDWKVDATK